MSRKWRNILIGVVVVAAIVAVIMLLNRGSSDFREKYSDTYDAYLDAHANDAYAKESVSVDVAKYTYNKTLEDQALKEEAERLKREGSGSNPAPAAAAPAAAPADSAENPDGGANPETAGEPEPAGENAETGNADTASEPESGSEGDESAAGGNGEGEEAHTQEEGQPEPETVNPDSAPPAPKKASAVKTDKLDMTWKVQVPASGMYCIQVEYEFERAEAKKTEPPAAEQPAETTAAEQPAEEQPAEEQPAKEQPEKTEEVKTAEIIAQAKPADEIYVMRQLLIGGALPFSEAGEIKFAAPAANEVQKKYIRDDLGYHSSPYMFYLGAGENTLTLKLKNEEENKARVTIRSITLVPPAQAVADDNAAKAEELKRSSNTAIGSLSRYDDYLAAYASYDPVQSIVENDELSIINGESLNKSKEYDGILTDINSDITWKVPDDIQPGMYNIELKYMTEKGRGIDIERELLINGKAPFSGAETLTFTRIWQDSPEDFDEDGTFRNDNQNNEIRPRQVEVFGREQTVLLHDSLGYQTEPYKFFIQPGDELTLKSVNEPMVILSIRLRPVAQYPNYEKYLQDKTAQMTDTGKNFSLTIQGERAKRRSASSLYPRYDRSSSQTDPYSVTNTIMNYIGGDPWTHPGEWIEWEFEVPETGFYNISIKARQIYQRGALSARTVYIDEDILFKEMESVTFGYNTSWEMKTLGDDSGKPYRFYLESGKHTLRMEVTMGKMGPILQDVKDSILRLNEIYRGLLVLTGAVPDRFRDYNLANTYPDAIRKMEREYKRLYKIVDDIVAITGEKNDRAAVALSLATQMERFVENNDRITESFVNFKDNITSLGTAMQNMSESKLDVDLIMITGENASIPKVGENFFQSAAHEIRSCISSYTVDYNTLGDKYEDTDEVLEVWITTGRDQSTVLKTIVDELFTNGENSKGIKVNVKLVQADAILPAVVSGNGPDVVISVSGWFAVNYAMRNAVEDLTQFDDFDEVKERFYPEILTPLKYNNGTKIGVYGLPETQNFPVLFYRTDIMQQLGEALGLKDGLPIPETWDQLIEELPTIQGNNMEVGIPFPDIAVADISIFNTLVYQNGGEIYEEDAKHTVIDSEEGIRAFKLYTSLYNDYGLPVVYDFVSRFRSGQMPLGIAPYATFNTLMISAPEIRGLWNFKRMPGTMRDVFDEDGNPVYETDGNGNPVMVRDETGAMIPKQKQELDYTCHTDGLCCMIIKTDDETTRNNAWEFIKWWTGAEAQERFGKEMESVLGNSARYQTANIEALQKLSWSESQLKILNDQMEHSKGFPEIAGGYSTTRHITNAIRRVINTKEDARETLLNYARTINEEIRIKRQEFNLPTD